jgi:hypothetical protein
MTVANRGFIGFLDILMTFGGAALQPSLRRKFIVWGSWQYANRISPGPTGGHWTES